MKKSDLAAALATLLCLDRVMVKDLENLQIETLEKMYHNYNQNAKDANNHLEQQMGITYKDALNSSKRRRIHNTKRTNKQNTTTR